MEIESSPAKPSIEMKLKVEVRNAVTFLLIFTSSIFWFLGSTKTEMTSLLPVPVIVRRPLLVLARDAGEVPADRSGRMMNDCDGFQTRNLQKNSIAVRTTELRALFHLGWSLVTCRWSLVKYLCNWGVLINGE